MFASQKILKRQWYRLQLLDQAALAGKTFGFNFSTKVSPSNFSGAFNSQVPFLGFFFKVLDVHCGVPYGVWKTTGFPPKQSFTKPGFSQETFTKRVFGPPPKKKELYERSFIVIPPTKKKSTIFKIRSFTKLTKQTPPSFPAFPERRPTTRPGACSANASGRRGDLGGVQTGKPGLPFGGL